MKDLIQRIAPTVLTICDPLTRMAPLMNAPVQMARKERRLLKNMKVRMHKAA